LGLELPRFFEIRHAHLSKPVAYSRATAALWLRKFPNKVRASKIEFTWKDVKPLVGCRKKSEFCRAVWHCAARGGGAFLAGKIARTLRTLPKRANSSRDIEFKNVRIAWKNAPLKGAKWDDGGRKSEAGKILGRRMFWEMRLSNGK
jgi:hypothetical protein